MKKFFRRALLIAAFAFTALFHSTNPAIAVPGPYAEARSAVVLLSSGRGNASAVVVEPGLLLTAAHVAQVPGLFLEPGHRPVRVLRVDEKNDIALLGADVACPCAALAVGAPVKDEAVIVIGFPMYEAVEMQILTRGYVQGLLENRLQLTVNAAAGNSGGGAFVRRAGHWRLIGIAVEVPLQYGQASFGQVVVPANYLLRVVDPKTMRDFLYERQSAASKS